MKHDIRYYISKGMDEKAATYFALGRRKVTHVVPNDDFTLTLTFDNGEKRCYDVNPLLKQGTVFAPLSDPVCFRRVYIDTSGAVAWDIDPKIDSDVVWNNHIDLCPDSCYINSTELIS